MTSPSPQVDTRRHVWPTWLVTARHRAVVSSGDDSGWFPVGERHARQAGHDLTACGLFAVGWPMFWTMAFERTAAGSCRACANVVTGRSRAGT